MHAIENRGSVGAAAAGWAAAVTAVAVVGGLATDTSSDWYTNLERPSWQPPGSVFGPVWTVLYVLIAIAATLLVPATWVGRGGASCSACSPRTWP